MLAQVVTQVQEPLTNAEFGLRLAVALALGAIVGVERQWRQGFAGVRTYSLVSVGAALFVLFSFEVGDPSQTRVAAQVVSGIGFLGAGVIMRDGASVRGLTTAAGLWCSAAIGALAAGGFFPGAVMGAVAILAANIVLRPIKRAINSRGQGSVEELEPESYMLRVTCRSKKELAVRSLIVTTANDAHCRVVSLMGVPTSTPSRIEVQAEIEPVGDDADSVHSILGRLSLDASVLGVALESASAFEAAEAGEEDEETEETEEEAAFAAEDEEVEPDADEIARRERRREKGRRKNR